MWPGLIQTAKEGGIDVIETYVFWNGHELSPGNVSHALLVLVCCITTTIVLYQVL